MNNLKVRRWTSAFGQSIVALLLIEFPFRVHNAVLQIIPIKYSHAALLSYFYLFFQILTYPFILELLRVQHVSDKVEQFLPRLQRDIRVPDG
jgi:hypothetical protein